MRNLASDEHRSKKTMVVVLIIKKMMGVKEREEVARRPGYPLSLSLRLTLDSDLNKKNQNPLPRLRNPSSDEMMSGFARSHAGQ
jgi:hypothetical protein